MYTGGLKGNYNQNLPKLVSLEKEALIVSCLVIIDQMNLSLLAHKQYGSYIYESQDVLR